MLLVRGLLGLAQRLELAAAAGTGTGTSTQREALLLLQNALAAGVHFQLGINRRSAAQRNAGQRVRERRHQTGENLGISGALIVGAD